MLGELCGLEYGAEIHLSAKEPEAVTVLIVRCGEHLEGQVLTGCVRVEAWNERDGLASTTDTRNYPMIDCTPVPEPSLSIALTVGALWLGAIAILGPAIGGWLNRNQPRRDASDASDASSVKPSPHD
jgi:hypothetical protein